MSSTSSPASNYEKYKDSAWYRREVSEIDPFVARLFEQRDIPPSELVRHVEHIQHKAFEIHPWPCIGGYYFLLTYMKKQEILPTILPRLQHGDSTILDLGCALGQDIRVLISEGVPSRNIHALDRLHDFWDLGFELFNDKIGTGRGMEDVEFRTHNFLQGVPEGWRGKMDFIFAGAFFHVFDYQDQLTASRNAAKLLRPQAGSLIFGYQAGRVTAAEVPLMMGASKSGAVFWHNPETFDKMWQGIGAELGVQFKTHLTFDTKDMEDFTEMDEEMRSIRFVVEGIA